MLTAVMQTNSEPPRGLAASRFANSPGSEDQDSTSADKAAEGSAAEGETNEPDNSSAAIASVRTTLAYRSIFI